jgi:toxin CptA
MTTRAVLAVEVIDQETAALQESNGDCLAARILGTSYVTATLTVLNLRVAGEWLPRHVLLVRDNVDEQEFRRLRVLLRWKRPAPTASDARMPAE